MKKGSNYNYEKKVLKPMPKLKIICGKKYGLPFDYLMTDIYSGCLNYNNMCYNNCSAALFWFENGYDFGKKTINEFDEKLFLEALNNLPKSQKWLRQGWVSDCSFSDESWQLVGIISDILASRDIRMMIISKIHKVPNLEIVDKLAKNKVEIRVSLSALDTEIELNRRLDFLKLYKQHKGIAIPYLMTALFKDEKLKNRQQKIIDFVIKNNFIAGEHPLRIDKDNVIFKQLCDNGFYHPKYENQYWFGRILYDIPNFILPAPTHLTANYRINSINFSEFKKNTYDNIDLKNLPTILELKNKKYTKELFDHAAYSIQK